MLVFAAVTVADWGIVLFALLMGYWGYRQGLMVGFFSLAGFALGAWLGSRLGPTLLADGSESPYAPLTALVGALLVGGIAAILLEGAAQVWRARLLRGGAATVDAAGGAALMAALAVGLAWLVGAVALNVPGAKELRQEVQRSVILQALNEAVPPSGSLLNALNRIDPGISITGPDPGVGPPDSAIARDPEIRAAAAGVVRVLGTACGLGVSGSGWVAAPEIVVTNAHVVAGQEDTAVSALDDDDRLDADPVHYDPRNDLAVLSVDGLEAPPLSLAGDPRAGTSGAVLGYPEDGPFTIEPARLGSTGVARTQDSYGRGPFTRELTAVRGEIRSGNSGGPVVDGAGRVLTTVFAGTTQGSPAGYGVPNEIVSSALRARGGEVDTGPCA